MRNSDGALAGTSFRAGVAFLRLALGAGAALSLAGTGLAAAEERSDLAYVYPLVNQTLETERTDVDVRWANPETGNAGTITVRRTFYPEPGQPCREYVRTLERAGAPPLVTKGTGCRVGPGRWKLKEDEPAERAATAPPAGRASAVQDARAATSAEVDPPAGTDRASEERREATAPARSRRSREDRETAAFPDFTLPSRTAPSEF